MRRGVAWLVLAACACHRVESPPPPPAACLCSEPDAGRPASTVVAPKFFRKEPTAGAPRVTPLAVCDAKGLLPLEAAQHAFDRGDFEGALSCAAQAAALAPDDVLAHVEKANALAALFRFEEAKLAYARALAAQPDSLDALAAAAHFFTVVAASSREHDELGALYADRGYELARLWGEPELVLQFARLSAMAYNDVGHSSEALLRAEAVLERMAQDPEALYEKAVALFELCRLDEARSIFERLLADPERAAHAHEHLALILERTGRRADAELHFARARELAPEDFPAPVLLGEAEFRRQVADAVEALPEDMRRDLLGVQVETADLPLLNDLLATEPPLSPSILGLFRGPSLGEPCEGGTGAPAQAVRATPPAASGCRSLVLYRKNLARAVTTREELIEQIRVTLLHEVGHLRGEDDYELAARGLE